jgi:hypothetical protein
MPLDCATRGKPKATGLAALADAAGAVHFAR